MLDVKKWMTKVTEALAGRPSWSYGGDVYWWGNSWTVPDNGFLEVVINPSASNWLWYISDSGVPDTGWSHRFSGASSSSQTHIILVKKGSVLQTYSMSNISSANCYYYKFNIVGGGSQ